MIPEIMIIEINTKRFSFYSLYMSGIYGAGME